MTDSICNEKKSVHADFLIQIKQLGTNIKCYNMQLNERNPIATL